MEGAERARERGSTVAMAASDRAGRTAARMSRIIFMGTPEFAVPSLEALAGHYEIVGVVTQPDRRGGRGRRELIPPPVRVAAQALVAPVIQVQTLRTPEMVETLRALAPDVIVIAAFGQILRQAVLSIPPHGCINVHASLLPKYRGAAPISAAILCPMMAPGCVTP